MSMYIFAPAGDKQLRNTFLKIGVEYIGSKQPGFGSSLAKGKRYIKSKLSCSGIAIKRAYSVNFKVINHDYKQLGTEVYYYHKDYCAEIVELILNYIVKNIEDPTLPQVFREVDFRQLLLKVYSHRISQLNWVRNKDYKGQRECAEQLYKKFVEMGY